MLVAGMSYTLIGTQLNGVSQAAAYAEGYQSATNYPLVRIVIAKTKHVFYARTFGHSGMGVAHGAASSTHFTVPAGIEGRARDAVRRGERDCLEPYFCDCGEEVVAPWKPPFPPYLRRVACLVLS
jgi:hypothetical protein